MKQKFNLKIPGELLVTNTVDQNVKSEYSDLEKLKKQDEVVADQKVNASVSDQIEEKKISPGSNLKTMLELAKELDVPKMKIYRYIKKYNYDTVDIDGVIYIPDTVQTLLKTNVLESNNDIYKASDTVSDMQSDIVYNKFDIENDMVILNQKTVNKALNKTVELLKSDIRKQDELIVHLKENNKKYQDIIDDLLNQEGKENSYVR